MKIKQYDTVVLKDGREAAIVEVLDNGIDFLVDVGDDPTTWENIHITIDDIERVIKNG